MIKIKIIAFVDENLAKLRKQFRIDLSSDFLKNKTSSLKFIKINKLFDQTRRRTFIFEKINNFEKNFIDY